MLGFIVFIGCIITCFGVLTTAVFYGDKTVLFLKDLDFRAGQAARDFRNREDIKKRRQAERTRLAMQEYSDALFREREEHRKSMQLQEAHATIRWEKEFHGEDNLPDDIKMLEAQVRTLYFSDMFSPIPAIDAPKQPIVVHPVTELVDDYVNRVQYLGVNEARDYLGLRKLSDDPPTPRDYYDPEQRDYNVGSPGYYKSYYRTDDEVTYVSEATRQRLLSEVEFDVKQEYRKKQMQKRR